MPRDSMTPRAARAVPAPSAAPAPPLRERLALAGAWLAVAIPSGWALSQVVAKALALFR